MIVWVKHSWPHTSNSVHVKHIYQVTELRFFLGSSILKSSELFSLYSPLLTNFLIRHLNMSITADEVLALTKPCTSKWSAANEVPPFFKKKINNVPNRQNPVVIKYRCLFKNIGPSNHKNCPTRCFLFFASDSLCHHQQVSCAHWTPTFIT